MHIIAPSRRHQIDHTLDQIVMFPNSPLHQMMQSMITFKVDRIMEAKLKTKRTQVSEEALMDMLNTRYAAASAGLKDALFYYIKNVLTWKTFKDTSDDLFIRKLERWSQIPEFADAFTQKVSNQRSSMHPLATVVKK